MANPRVHEIASELGVDSKTVLIGLKELGEFAKASSSSIKPPVARKVKALIRAQTESFRNVRIYFPTLGASQDTKNLTHFQDLPQTARELVEGLTRETAKHRDYSKALADSAQFGDLYIVERQDSHHLENTTLPHNLEPTQLFSEQGLLVAQNDDGVNRFIAWKLLKDGRDLRVASTQLRLNKQTGSTRLEATKPALFTAPLVNGRFSGTVHFEVAILRAIYELTPERNIPIPSTRFQGSGETPRPSSEVPYIRLYRPGTRIDQTSVESEKTGATKAAHSVRGHIRRQWYPSTEEHKEIWIEPYKTGDPDSDLPARKPYLVRPRKQDRQ